MFLRNRVRKGGGPEWFLPQFSEGKIPEPLTMSIGNTLKNLRDISFEVFDSTLGN